MNRQEAKTSIVVNTELLFFSKMPVCCFVQTIRVSSMTADSQSWPKKRIDLPISPVSFGHKVHLLRNTVVLVTNRESGGNS